LSSTIAGTSTEKGNSEAMGDVVVPKARCAVCTELLQQVWWDFWCPWWFLMASLVYMAQAVHGMTDNADPVVHFVLDIWASHLFLVDALCGLIYWWLYRQRNFGTPDALFLCTSVPRQVDWCGWGDWLFLVGAAVDSLNCYLYEADEVYGNYLNVFSSVVWTIDCVFYFVSYKFESRSFLVSTTKVSDSPKANDGPPMETDVDDTKQ